MNDDHIVSPTTRMIAEKYLGRPLVPAEMQMLAQYERAHAEAPREAGDAQAVRAQAQWLAEGGAERSQARVRDILQVLQHSSQKAQDTQKRAEQEILKTVERANSLSGLRPTEPPASAPAVGNETVNQIADRLAKLVKDEVEKAFQSQFGALQRQLDEAVRLLKETR
ncbi:hypothetical protein [Dyella sp.]|uniref:hypothetical protein n=1 Tax=Dyella sp. TaxID=1869338 RepID=UPI002ED54D26